MLARHVREDDGSECNPEHAERKLDHPVRKIQPRHATGDEKRRDHRVDEQIDLGDGDPEHGWDDQRNHPRNAVVGAAQAWSDRHPERGEKRELERELNESGREHAPGKCDHGDIEHRCQPQGGADQADVEQHRSEGRDRKPAVGIENAPREGDQGNEEHVRKRDPHHLDCERVLFGVGQKPGGEDRNQHRRGYDADDGDDGEHPDQSPRDMRDEIAYFTNLALCLIFAQNRHERLGEGTLGEQPTQEVRETKCDEERVGARTGAERLGDHHIAHESECARRQRARADHPRRFEKRPAHRTGIGRRGFQLRQVGTEGMEEVGVLSGIRTIGIIAHPLSPGQHQESQSSGKLCPSKKARTAGGTQPCP